MGKFIDITGDVELLAKLFRLGGPTAIKCARQGIMAGLVPLGKAIRQQVNATNIPPSQARLVGNRTAKSERQGVADLKRGVRQAVGRRLLKSKLSAAKSKSTVIEVLSTQGTIQGKAGYAVGKRQPPRGKRAGRKGVGVGARNVHWFVLGTKDRYIQSGPRAGQWTGRIRPYFLGAIERATTQSVGIVNQAMATRIRTVIETEARKGK